MLKESLTTTSRMKISWWPGETGVSWKAIIDFFGVMANTHIINIYQGRSAECDPPGLWFCCQGGRGGHQVADTRHRV